MVLCWFISLTFCAVLWKLHSFLTVIYNYHQRQVIFLPWSILLHIYAIVFIIISGRQMEFGWFFFLMYPELARNFWGIQREGELRCSCTRVHTMDWCHICARLEQALLSSVFPCQVSVLSYEEIWLHSTKKLMPNFNRCIYFNSQETNILKHMMGFITPMD